LKEKIKAAITQYPDDRDLRKIVRQFNATERQGGKTKPIIEKFNQRLSILKIGNLPQT